ncbi:hypothetical protein [Sphingomicrobium aestuariivivum]|uniref:hypothetical protein n=1 Tax=Sphingomicrobium aestuariivivum TaxID=1582356 RepID=UPI001FD6F19B|nr:hypothetical protein [Sphingomicrobium aestuariivivum]MCJ8192034.1 hypothetical protein [Sphingomicrobium aestuariivivum]
MKKTFFLVAAASVFTTTASPSLAISSQTADASRRAVQVQDQFRLLHGVGGGVTICEYSVFAVGQPTAVTVINYKPNDPFYLECEKRASAGKSPIRTVSLENLPPCSGKPRGGGTVMGVNPLPGSREVCPQAFGAGAGKISPLVGVAVAGATGAAIAVASSGGDSDPSPVSP